MSDDILLAVMTSKYDEGLAYCRDWVSRHDDDSELFAWVNRLAEEMESKDAHTALRAHFAMLGFMQGYIAAKGGA